MPEACPSDSKTPFENPTYIPAIIIRIVGVRHFGVVSNTISVEKIPNYFTKWVEAKPLATITKKKVEGMVWKDIICHFGIP